MERDHGTAFGIVDKYRPFAMLIIRTIRGSQDIFSLERLIATPNPRMRIPEKTTFQNPFFRKK
jgi:hypothetical protein